MFSQPSPLAGSSNRLSETQIIGADGQVKAVLRFLNPADKRPEVIEAFVRLMVQEGQIAPEEPLTVK
jgi:hypothetical protein